RSLNRQGMPSFRLRRWLAWGLLAVTAIDGVGAWWIARRALAPLRDITARARELGASLDGDLPRSGRGDELDRLAGVLNDLLGRIRSEGQRMRPPTAHAPPPPPPPPTAIPR